MPLEFIGSSSHLESIYPLIFHSIPFSIFHPHHVFILHPPSSIPTSPSAMKFGKRLKLQIQESLPQWRDNYISYKHLKRIISSSRLSSPHNVESLFLFTLNREIEKFNSFFMEQEEDFIIRHKELQQRLRGTLQEWGIDGAHTSRRFCLEQMEKMKKEIVNFHGEMVLLESYSNINYTGMAKILKKYDKRRGGFMRSFFIKKVLEQPFFTTDMLSKMIHDCENTMDTVLQLVPNKDEREETSVDLEPEGIMVREEGVFRHTVAALLTMEEMRRGSSTQSKFSLPPLNLPHSDLIRSIHFNSSPIITTIT